MVFTLRTCSMIVGNSDLLFIVTYTDSEESHHTIAAIKSTCEVSRVWWSDEGYNLYGRIILSLLQ